MKRVFGTVEAVFDIAYMLLALTLGLILIFSASGREERILSGIMALVLVIGDSFHLIPRIKLIRTGKEQELRKKLGRGKQITSITMTVFYLILWHIGLIVFSPSNIQLVTYAVYILAIIRIVICLLPQNKWEERFPPLSWGIWRNIPFFLQGIVVSGLFFIYRNLNLSLNLMWLAIILSFAFYLPVVIWSNKNPKVGMLMLPKTCTYLWMLFMCMSL